MEISVVDLINCLRLEGPHNIERIRTVSEEDAPTPGDELTDEGGGSKEEGDDSTEAAPIKEADPEEDPSEGEP